VLADGEVVGEVTSGTFSPSLEEGIALALVDRKALEAKELAVRIRNRDARAVRVKKTFV
jgi:aminomethyltransferase